MIFFACAPPPLQATVESDPSGLVVHANQTLDTVEVRRAGKLLARQTSPGSEAVLRVPQVDALTVSLSAGSQQMLLEVPAAGPFDAWFEAPLGQGRIPVGTPVAPGRGALVVQPRVDGLFTWTGGSGTLVAGVRRVVPLDLTRSVRMHVEGGDSRRVLELEVQDLPAPQLAMQLHFPAQPDGTVDATRPGEIRLPSPWWDALLDRLGLGFRTRDDQGPRAWVGVTLSNPDRVARNVVITADIPHEAFRPRLRDSVLSHVARTVYLPPETSVRAALPVYLDRSAVPGSLAQPVRVEVSLIGGAPLLSQSLTLEVTRGSRWASAWVVAGVGFALVGWGLLITRGRHWMHRPTAELTTIAMFGACTFAVSTVSQVVGLGVATVLGPFAPFVLGLGDDAVRMCLSAALVVLLPRVGVVSLALLIGWLMRALVLGAAHPIDVVYLGAAVCTQEGALYLSGLTRGRPVALWRLIVGLALPHAFSAGLALALSSVLYRLFYAEAYVAAIVVLPGFLYAALGCVLALPFVERVRP